MLRATNGCRARVLCRCRAWATRSLPVPDSPVISTVIGVRASRPMARNRACIAGAWPTSISSANPGAACAPSAASALSQARRTSATAASRSNGLAR